MNITKAGKITSIVSQPKTLSIMLTYACPAECRDCGTLSSPRSKEQIGIEQAKRYMNEVHEMGDFQVVVFTGGEATLRWKDLVEGIRHASGLGLTARLVTNAHWANRVDTTSTKLSELVAAGLTEINFSTGDEHARFISLDRVALATKVALEFGLRVCVMIEQRADRTVTQEMFEAHQLVSGIAKQDRHRLSIVESPWMPLDPLEKADYESLLSRGEEGIDRPCTNVLSTYTIQADGRIGACCGLGMRQIDELNIGHIGDQLQVVRSLAESDVIKLAIRYLGPEYLLRWSEKWLPDLNWRDMYAHHCQACARVYSDSAVKDVLMANLDDLKERIRAVVLFDEGFGRSYVAGEGPQTHQGASK
ncbi:radical SAM protein [Xanthomonas oryzae]|uniref:radical SAM protein n=1 Tax=Xanthomonas oryzae TaxID=347 RepID=UPI00094A12CD|nr:hypothetical protein [Xanthomonas oryzae]RBL08139.1 radical SAM protein [Xanthomonas oryzae pv. oryzae]UWU54730.1 radical SAM protein [Xanthomonas oryzae pv. oryzae]UWZ70743.1 hypothetical protein BHL62_22775 [Xanthomonas oryzae pv. oryzae]UXV91807.1 radical SAM protein [Xanthomonas oryzae pv. oryzae]